MGVEVREAQLSEKVLRFNLTNEGGVDGTYRLLKNIIGLWLVQQCKRAFEAKGKKFSYEKLVQLARRAKPLRSIIDPDDSRFLNPPNMALAIQQFCSEARQPIPQSEGEIVRCALESLALFYRITSGQLEQFVGKKIERLNIVGGGSKNTLLNQFAANALQIPIIAGPAECTALGNILVQAIALGHLPSLAAAREVVRNSFEVTTVEPQAGAEWDGAFERFEKLAASASGPR